MQENTVCCFLLIKKIIIDTNRSEAEEKMYSSKKIYKKKIQLF